MNVLVTGAGGRLGRALVPALLAEGHTVRCLVMHNDPQASQLATLGERVHVVRGQLEYFSELEPAVAGVEAIVHFGAAMGDFSDDQFFETNVRGTYNVLQAVRRAAPGLRRFVFASSDAVYEKYVAGGYRTPINPDVTPRDGKGLYALSKIMGEELCWGFWRSFGIPTVVLRLPVARAAAELPEFYEFWLDGLLRHKRAQRRVDPEASRAVEILESLERGNPAGRRLVVAKDEFGQPYQRVFVDPRDVGQAVILALLSDAAVGHAFPVAGKDQPVTADKVVPYLARRLRLPYVEVSLPGIPTHYAHDARKTAALMGYAPRYDVFAMIDEALGPRAGRPGRGQTARQ
jgi:UDP-glucose 4-epimerase